MDGHPSSSGSWTESRLQAGSPSLPVGDLTEIVVTRSWHNVPIAVNGYAWSVAGHLLLEVGQRADRRLDYRGVRALRATQQPLAEQRLRLAGATLLSEVPGIAHGGAEAVHWVTTLLGQCHCALPFALRLSQQSSRVFGSFL